MKRAHEAPKSIFEMVQKNTDYDYFLVHLFEEDPEYFQLAKDAVAKGRETILDSSIFELGKAFESEKYAYWINELKPTYYIIPDSLENFEETRNNAIHWNKEYRDKLSSKCIGVLQGKTYEELVMCYKFLHDAIKVDKIAVPFDLSYYTKSYPHSSTLISWCFGRIKLLGDLMKDRVIDPNMPVHLLGCSLPMEFMYYDESYSFIDSADTSNPVVAGINYTYYDTAIGLYSKNRTKLYTMMDMELTEDQIKLIHHNISIFKQFCDRKYFI